MAARYVSADSGTGLVHTAPAHGADDYNTFLSQGLLAHTSIPSLVDGEGQFTETLLDMVADKSIAERLVGKFVLGAGTRIMIEIMQENSMLLAEQKIQHKYPYDWKTKKPVIVRQVLWIFSRVARIDMHYYSELPLSGLLTWTISRPLH